MLSQEVKNGALAKGSLFYLRKYDALHTKTRIQFEMCSRNSGEHVEIHQISVQLHIKN